MGNIVALPAMLLFAATILFLVTALLQWLWNMTMPQVFNLKEVSFWEAFRLILIAGILFGGPGFIK